MLHWGPALTFEISGWGRIAGVASTCSASRSINVDAWRCKRFGRTTQVDISSFETEANFWSLQIDTKAWPLHLQQAKLYPAARRSRLRAQVLAFRKWVVDQELRMRAVVQL